MLRRTLGPWDPGTLGARDFKSSRRKQLLLGEAMESFGCYVYFKCET